MSSSAQINNTNNHLLNSNNQSYNSNSNNNSSTHSSSSLLSNNLNNKSSSASNDNQEFLEVKSVSLEWKISNLKSVFDSSKGETKSKCIRSSYFGDGKWQVFFYPNSGHEQYCSLYLSCQPTSEELERGATLVKSSSRKALSLSYDLILKNQSLTELFAHQILAIDSHRRNIDLSQVPWHREGLFKFTFEIKSLDRRTNYKTMEANDHAFSHEARNWGWAQYWRRNDAYYSNTSAKYNDSFLICCTIVYSPSPPISPPSPLVLKKLIPIDLLEAYSSLFNEPLYSDVCFEIIRPRRNLPGSNNFNENDRERKKSKIVRRLYASKKILIRRSEYFMTMFDSGFAESSSPNVLSTDRLEQMHQRDLSGHELSSVESKTEEEIEADNLMEEDSDDFDDHEVPGEEYDEEEVEDEKEDEDEAEKEERKGEVILEEIENERNFESGLEDETIDDQSSSSEKKALSSCKLDRLSNQKVNSSNPLVIVDSSGIDPTIGVETKTTKLQRSSQLYLSSSKQQSSTTHDLKPISSGPSSSSSLARNGGGDNSKKDLYNQNFHDDRTASPNRSNSSKFKKAQRREISNKRSSRGSYCDRKMTVIEVTDAAYTTFKALLFFLYTDTITFAPLSSTYNCLRDEALENGIGFNFKSKRDYVRNILLPNTSIVNLNLTDQDIVCSAKAIYRLADKLNLVDLKARAYDHITKSLTVQNIPLEVFSSFTSAFEEVRRVEVRFMLQNWNEVREGRSMRKVLDSMRDGAKIYPGFSEVWSMVLSNLEYKPKPGSLLLSSSSLPINGGSGGNGYGDGGSGSGYFASTRAVGPTSAGDGREGYEIYRVDGTEGVNHNHAHGRIG
ncbi:hypothetical protein BY996DRAFT_4579384 [Phakopsora pachyrhizi]|uniref:MATH domain-containing protein n=1 Tax=Phakopsora pachyrhizi TaxID=170000 RepID=A0AAV0AI02_PHAPC|nr:hypothetical protein BY996DRAFT_4579384 [Phakopsora pachyrhizi]CAH7667576.1 hypothetical protein PPACK8108_LOCUS1982 [Phakopsora pachyrhizi]